MNQPLPGAARTRVADAPGRVGSVALELKRSPEARSYIARQHATYPFHICRPHYFADDPQGMATLYLQSIAGGVFEHDRLAMEVTAGAGTALHLTSQGATIVHAMTRGSASLSTTLAAGDGSVVELMPEATILFPGTDLRLTTDISAADGAVVCVSESFLAHDPENSDAVFARFVSDVRFRTVDGRVLAHDRQAASGAEFRRMACTSGATLAAYGAIHLWATGRDLAKLQESVASAIGVDPSTLAGVSPLPHACGLAVRVLAVDGAALRIALTRGWCAIREGLFGTAPARRRK